MLIQSTIVVVVVTAFAALLITRRATPQQIDGFAELYAVPLVEENRQLIDDALTRTRRFRVGGAAATVLAIAVTLPRSLGFGNLLAAVAIGFALGSIADELTQRRPNGPIAAASLDSRTLRTYVERRVLFAAAIIFMVALGQLAIGYWLNQTWVGASEGFARPPRQRLLGLTGVLGLGSVAVAATIARRLVRRPVIVDHPSRQAARHGLRVAAILSVTGAAIMTLGVAGIQVANANVLADSDASKVIQWVNNLSLLACLIAIVFGWSMSFYALPRRANLGNPQPSSAPKVAS